MTSSIRNARNVLAVCFFIVSNVFASEQAEGRVQSWEKANSVAAVVGSPYRFLGLDQDKTWQILQIDTRKTSPGNFTSTTRDRKSTRLNSSHEWISYAVFCL